MIAERIWWTAYLIARCRGQARYAFRPIEAIRRDQTRRVRRMVAYAWRHVPYYRETMGRLGLTPGDFQCADDLAKLPILDREQLQRDPERFVSATQRLDRCLRCTTSGSTGQPIVVYFDPAAIFQAVACAERARATVRALLGGKRTYRETSIVGARGTDARLSEFRRAHTLVPRGMPVRAQRLSVADPVEVNAARMAEFKPDLLRSFGSYLEVLFPYLRAAGYRGHLPGLVAYGGDCLSDAARRLITEEFGIPVLSGYQAVEALCIACECERHTGLHVNLDLHPVRIVDGDGRPRPVGQTGEVIVSTLNNHATVLLNYRLGDLAALLPASCPCGRSLPLMSLPQGRLHDFIESPSGQLTNAQAVAAAITHNVAIWQYEIVQVSRTDFQVRLILAQDCDRDDVRQRVQTAFARALGGPVNVDVAFVEAIERAPSGKHRPVRSLVPRAQRYPAEPRGQEGAP